MLGPIVESAEITGAGALTGGLAGAAATGGVGAPAGAVKEAGAARRGEAAEPKPEVPEPKPATATSKGKYEPGDVKAVKVSRSGQTKFRTGERTFVHDEKRRLIVEVVDGKPVTVYDGAGVSDAPKIIAAYLNGKDLAEVFPKKDYGYVSTSLGVESSVGRIDHGGEASRDKFAEDGGKYIKEEGKFVREHLKYTGVDGVVAVENDVKSTSETAEVVRPLIGKVLENVRLKLKGTISGRSLQKLTRDDGTIKKSASPKLHALAVANIKNLFENAVIDVTHPDTKNDTNIAQIHRVGAFMEYGGEIYPVKITVKEYYDSNKENRIYSVEALTVEKMKSVGQLTDADREAGIQVPITDFNNKILQFLEKVNSKDKNSSGAASDDSFVDLGDAAETDATAGPRPLSQPELVRLAKAILGGDFSNGIKILNRPKSGAYGFAFLGENGEWVSVKLDAPLSNKLFGKLDNISAHRSITASIFGLYHKFSRLSTDLFAHFVRGTVCFKTLQIKLKSS
jgi:hypothetical protein